MLLCWNLLVVVHTVAVMLRMKYVGVVIDWPVLQVFLLILMWELLCFSNVCSLQRLFGRSIVLHVPI